MQHHECHNISLIKESPVGFGIFPCHTESLTILYLLEVEVTTTLTGCLKDKKTVSEYQIPLLCELL